ncbi:MAG: SsrA-binding protein SmpB [Desulfarculaceae bacterium]|nr:SsrA-binding protein SmpB [Desulfarculaceae bacterium]MCF8046873.1 SsrA-binding protein SmpB [Desulfarculaceae bacterium]MCF8066169.1 SsrA-binding protein SmpB [Desulfarculaceae bacterium]MCF8098959.1 SsrA-binding protein SmpB [Desulfarculaceae bacterium]MCF8121360.1 SsrA-binding protein SmpB [Desulfarculaceae bacterium]
MEGGNIKIVARNKKARFDYELSDRFEAGLVLTGTEVKSLRLGKASLSEAYAKVSNGEAWLVGCQIQPYPFAYYDNHEPTRQRKLLLHKRELKRLGVKLAEQGYSLIPTAMYFKRGKAKVELALARGKKKHDKRASIKKREQQREMARALKR